MHTRIAICFLLGAAGLAGAQEYRTIDGSFNNLDHPDWGTVGTELLRGNSGAHYADGIGQMVSRENPRVISNTVSAQVTTQKNTRGLTSMAWLWGQFTDHDLDLVASNPGEFDPIVPPLDDPHFPPGEIIPFARSSYVAGVDTPRQHVNEISHWIDGSNVYGSDQARADWLRTGSGGRMKLDGDGYLPRNTAGFDNANEGPFDDEDMFLAGDVRANENAGLTAMHTVWVREHNRWADRLSADNPGWDDEQVYQMARKVVGAEMQHITYDQWLPAMLGGHAMDEYVGYDSEMNPNISSTFASATFRFGHSMVGELIERYDAGGDDFDGGHLELRHAFFNPHVVTEDGSFDAILRGFGTQQAEQMDTQIVDALRNFLFGPPGAGGLDLASLNIKRGRDHGTPDYNTLRLELGLDAVDEFGDITSDDDLAASLASLYGDVDNIDAWVGTLAEDRLPGAAGGETFVAALAEMFARIRDCDRFYYLNDPAMEDYLSEIERLSLADVISINTGAELTGNVFFVPAPGSLGVLLAGGVLAARRRRQA